MKIIKPFIREFKGIPIRISWFVIYRTRPPKIETRVLSLETKVIGDSFKKIDRGIEILDFMSFYSASIEFLKTAEIMIKKQQKKVIKNG